MSKLEIRGFYLLLGFIVAMMLLRPQPRKEEAKSQDQAMSDIAQRLGKKSVAFEQAQGNFTDASQTAARTGQTRNVS